MILELLALGGALAAGRAAWRRRRKALPVPELQVPDEGPTEMRWLDDELITGTAAVALAGASFALRSSPLGLASAPFTLWSSRSLIGDAHQKLVSERRVGFVVVDAGLTVVGLLAGAWIMAAGGTMIYVGWRKLADWERVQAGRARRRADATPTPAADTAWQALGRIGEWAVPADHIDLGDRIRVRDGDGIPVDAWIAAGTARLDPGDGRLQPLALGPGDRAPAGARVISGALELRARGTVDDSRHGRLRATPNAAPLDLEPVAERAGRLADASTGFTVMTGALAALTLGGTAALSAFGGNLLGAYRVIAPAALESHLHALSALGVRIEDGRRFELLAGVSVVLLELSTLVDSERLSVSRIRAIAGFEPARALRWAAALTSGRDEAIRPALVEALSLRGLTAEGEPVVPRGGVYRGWVDGRSVSVGAAATLRAEGVDGDTGLDAVRRAAHQRGDTTLTVAADGAEVAVIAFEPALRPGAERLMPELRQRGIEPILLLAEGDRVADHWGERIGAGQIITERDPEAIADYVGTLRTAGRMAAALGDRVVHRAMMGAADISIALTSDAAVARGAGIVMSGQPLDRVPALIDLARRYHRAQGRLMAWNTAATGLLGFGVLAFGVGPVAAIGVQAVGAAVGLVSTLPDVEALAGPPPAEAPAEAERAPAPGPVKAHA